MEVYHYSLEHAWKKDLCPLASFYEYVWEEQVLAVLDHQTAMAQFNSGIVYTKQSAGVYISTVSVFHDLLAVPSSRVSRWLQCDSQNGPI